MIVICTKCRAKFRVADDRIGPRGAKVRCSKCQTVFLVHPSLGTLPVSDGEARPAPAGAGVMRAEPAAAGQATPAGAPAPFADPFAAPQADPFAAPQADPFAPPAPPRADPFGGADPFAPTHPPPPVDGSAPAGPDDPFAPAPQRSSLPVTDLSDLLGAAAPAPAPPPRAQVPPPLPPAARGPAAQDPFAPADAEAAAAPAQPTAGADPFGPQDPFAGAGAHTAPAEEPSLDLALPTPADGGLSLEDRLTPPPARLDPTLPPEQPQLDVTLEAVPAAAGGLAAVDPFAAPPGPPAGSADPFDPGAFDFGGQGELAPPEPGAAPPAPEPAPFAAPPPAPRVEPAVPPAAVLAAAVTTAAVPAPLPDRIPGGRTSRLRAVAVNAVALLALLLVALALWVVWRTEGPFEAASLRPSAVLATLGRGASPGPWSAQDVRSGVYDRARGAPLLFVRGRVVCRAPAAVRAVKVAVQVVRGGRVLARGEALAGAVPNEEELYLAADAAAVAAAAGAARSRAPARIGPGDSVPFLVALGDAPADLEGASLEIAVAPAGGSAP